MSLRITQIVGQPSQGSPEEQGFVKDAEALDILKRILMELKKLNIQLSAMSDIETKEYDVEDNIV